MHENIFKKRINKFSMKILFLVQIDVKFLTTFRLYKLDCAHYKNIKITT